MARLMVFVLAFFLDYFELAFIVIPLLKPVADKLGIDLVWFGVILTVLIELGQITPPVGLNLFTIHAISGGAKFSEVAAGSAPYVMLMLLVILMLCLWPEIALSLPTTMRG